MVAKMYQVPSPSVRDRVSPQEWEARVELACAYRVAWHQLLAGGFLYPCRCSRKDLAAALSAPHESQSASSAAQSSAPEVEDDEPVYPGTCRPLQSADHSTFLANANWRFRVPDGEVVEFNDLNLGPQRFVAGVDFGDFVVWRRDQTSGSPRTLGVPGGRFLAAGERMALHPWGGVPSYQLACVADDAAMSITEVVRGADLLKSTARQILLNRALGYKNPAWYHCSLVADENGKRLAKRHDALSIRALRQRGLTPAEVLSARLPPPTA